MLISRVITVYIDSKIFEQMFNTIKELESIKEMISQASKGINIYGETRNIIAEKLVALCSKTGFEKVDSLLQIMNLISISPEKSFIINKNVEIPKGQKCDRLMYVLKYMQENLHEQITLNDVADIACMTTQSFCRYFKNAINKTFLEYLVELRINHACNLLIELDKPISDIAYLCGFVSHSHFCKLFKNHTGQSPHRYRSGIPKKAS
jgi:AraC-like DNA-binding protein